MIVPIVSVIMITYAHESYIKQAIEGVLMQQFEGAIEFIVADDKSPDRTDAVIQKIIHEHPNGSWLKYTKHTANKGMMPNFIWALQQAKGKYIALCEGDDYWTDPTKLQLQFNFMEQHPDYIMCCHDRNVVDEQNNILIKNQQTTKVDKDTFVQTLFYRNIPFDDLFYIYFEQAKNGDTFLIYRLHQLGKTHYFDFNGACYRVSDAGVWSKVSDEKRFEMSICSLNNMIAYYTILNDKKTVKEIQKWKAEQFLIKSKLLSEAGYKNSAFKHIFKYNALLLASNPRLFFSTNNLKTSTFLTTKFLLQ
jgi:glycosyltransferase involved in cell wall biosynthesis